MENNNPISAGTAAGRKRPLRDVSVAAAVGALASKPPAGPAPLAKMSPELRSTTEPAANSEAALISAAGSLKQ